MNRRCAEFIRTEVRCAPLEAVGDARQLDSRIDRRRPLAQSKFNNGGIVEL